MKVLVTGGTGFVGHHFVEHAIKSTDWEIEIIDKLSYSGDAAKVTELDCFDPNRVRIHWHDLRAPIMDSLAQELGEIDYIVNFASESHVDNSIVRPVEFIHNNVMLATNILEFASHNNIKKFIQISTDEVFGPAHGPGFAEWDSHVPSNPYSASKSAQESIAIAYWRTYNVPVIITNTMNMFGERQHPEKLIPKAIKYLLDGKHVPVHAKQDLSGNWVASSRFWLHARNHADAILWILQTQEPEMFPAYEKPMKYNISGDIELSALDIVNQIAEIMEVNSLVEFVDYHSHRPGHDMRYALDGQKILRAGWLPPVDFHKSLEKTVGWTVKNKDRWL